MEQATDILFQRSTREKFVCLVPLWDLKKVYFFDILSHMFLFPIDSDLPFAKCFICGETGHIARACPDNPKGLYPNGETCVQIGFVVM